MNLYLLYAFGAIVLLFVVLKGIQMVIYKGKPPKPQGCDEDSCSHCGMQSSCGLHGIDTGVSYKPAKRKDSDLF